MPLLSVVVPVYNEAKTIREILEKISAVNIDKEIIVVDDGSSDDTGKILREIKYSNLKVIHHTSNRGKGAAFLTGLSHAQGEYVVIQDADLEYDPQDYPKLMEAIIKENADFVLGARFLEGHTGLFMHRQGNKFLTRLFNFFFNTKFNDYSTCYKLFRRDALSLLNLESNSFDIDVEILAKAIKKKLKPSEAMIAYYPRTYAQGKKIRWIHGVQAIMAIIKYSII
ncbi:MAG: glycosyltransferase family 2 protein [Candidatus Omnitrophica bacterium]|jgi:glycosyltransferase involved in cell wall biosynthesis|nr:glycosyltransferase family 2 protein [Candidatus Omnitrophota bacterium]